MPKKLKGQGQYYRIINGDGDHVADMSDLIDELKQNVNTISSLHNHTHEGEAYSISHGFIAVADDAHADMLIRTGAIDVHIVAEIEGEGKAYAFLYEVPTITLDGTPLVPRNKYRSHNDNDPEQSSVLIFHTPTVGAVGTQLLTELITGGSGPQSIGSRGGRSAEWVLKKNTDYLFRVTNKTGQAKDFTIHPEWYEQNIPGGA